MVKCKINAYDWFGNLDAKILVIWTSKVMSFQLRKLGQVYVRSCALDFLKTKNTMLSDVTLVIMDVLMVSLGLRTS